MDVLPRWWNFQAYRRIGYKLGVNVSHISVDELLKKSWFVDFLKILDIEINDIHFFKLTTRVKDMVICSPLMMDRNFIHDTFSEFFYEIGNRALSYSGKKFSGSYYLSRSKIKHGNTFISNEKQIESIVENNGIEILYPEKLSVYDQISLFRDGTVFGFLGSGFHNSVFSVRSKGLCFSLKKEINRSYSLFDYATKSEINYVYAKNIVNKYKTSYSLSVEVVNLDELKSTVKNYQIGNIVGCLSYTYENDGIAYLKNINGPFYLKDYRGLVVLSNENKILCLNENEEKDYSPIEVYLYGDIAFIVDFRKESSIVEFEIFSIEFFSENSAFAFRSLNNDRYLSIDNNNSPPNIVCDRLLVNEWEIFSLYNKDGIPDREILFNILMSFLENRGLRNFDNCKDYATALEAKAIRRGLTKLTPL